MNTLLERLGLSLKAGYPPNLAPSLSVEDRAREALNFVLNSQLYAVVRVGCFPDEIGSAPGAREVSKVTKIFSGPFFLEITDAFDASCPPSERGKGLPRPNRFLKLGLTDGCRIAVGVEYAAIPDLKPPFAGTKLVVKDVEVQDGILLLTGANVRVLGGGVAPASPTVASDGIGNVIALSGGGATAPNITVAHKKESALEMEGASEVLCVDAEEDMNPGGIEIAVGMGNEVAENECPPKSGLMHAAPEGMENCIFAPIPAQNPFVPAPSLPPPSSAEDELVVDSFSNSTSIASPRWNLCGFLQGMSAGVCQSGETHIYDAFLGAMRSLKVLEGGSGSAPQFSLQALLVNDTVWQELRQAQESQGGDLLAAKEVEELVLRKFSGEGGRGGGDVSGGVESQQPPFSAAWVSVSSSVVQALMGVSPARFLVLRTKGGAGWNLREVRTRAGAMEQKMLEHRGGVRVKIDVGGVGEAEALGDLLQGGGGKLWELLSAVTILSLPPPPPPTLR